MDVGRAFANGADPAVSPAKQGTNNMLPAAGNDALISYMTSNAICDHSQNVLTATPVPEPATCLLMVEGLALVGVAAKRMTNG